MNNEPLLLATVIFAASCADVAARENASRDEGAATGGTLTLIRERSFAELLGEKGKYEASGVALEGGMLRVVFDDTMRVASVDMALSSAALGPGSDSSSQYEGITVASKPVARTYAVTEGGRGERSSIVTIDAQGKAVAVEPTDIVAAGDKGLEGLAWLDEIDRLLVLCEANSCGDGDLRPGNGSMRSLRREGAAWVTEATLAVPSRAAFTDYSDLAVWPEGDGRHRIAIVSQESSALWLGTLTTTPLAIVDAGDVYGFPKASGKTQYCSLEGVTFLDAGTLAFVSDRANESDECTKGEAVHVFALP